MQTPAADPTPRLIAEPLTVAAFAPFGTVASTPLPAEGRLVGPSDNLRPEARAELNWVIVAPQVLPFALAVMERHRYSSQSFLPCAPDARWLVVVAPHAAAGGPDMARAHAFVVGGDQAITYSPDTWHHPLTALDRPAPMALLTFRDGGADDDEFFTLPAPVLIVPA